MASIICAQYHFDLDWNQNAARDHTHAVPESPGQHRTIHALRKTPTSRRWRPHAETTPHERRSWAEMVQGDEDFEDDARIAALTGVCRRTNVVGTLPNEGGNHSPDWSAAIPVEQKDEWTVARRYMTLEIIAQLSNPQNGTPSATAAA